MRQFNRLWCGLLSCCLSIGILANAYAESLNLEPEADLSAPAADAPMSLKAGTAKSFVARKYILGPYDEISIQVFYSPEFDQKDIKIPPDGKLVLGPIGTVDAAGLTLEDLSQEIETRLTTYLRNPKVGVTLDRSKPFKVWVSGAVLHPGNYELATDPQQSQQIQNTNPEVLVTRRSPLLSNVLFATGGLRADADVEHVTITNKNDGTEFQVNLLDFVTQGDAAQDLYLIDGDSVNVPALPKTALIDPEKYKAMLGSTIFQKTIPVKVYGFVQNPGVYHLEAAQSANVNSAIASAGGFEKQASSYSGHVYVYRIKPDGNMGVKSVDPRHDDYTLMPNDIVYVPIQTIPRIGRFFDFAGRMIAPAALFAAGYNNWTLLFNPHRFNPAVNRF